MAGLLALLMGISAIASLNHNNNNVVAWDLPNQCDTFSVVYKNGKPRYKHIKTSKWTEKDRVRAKKLAKMVAKEMGADHRLLHLWMDRGSNSNPHILHLLRSDREADLAAWKNHRYSSKLEQKLERKLWSLLPTSKEYWQTKGKLHRIRKYKDNNYFQQFMEYEIVRNGDKSTGRRPYFALKYGPLDMSAVGYTKYWSTQAPPWIMCNDDGLIAYIVAIWAMRSFKRSCKDKMKNGDTYGVIDRRYARGHCDEASDDFRKRAKLIGLNPDQEAKLGTKWKRETTDRHEIYVYMRKKAVEKGLLQNEQHRNENGSSSFNSTATKVSP